MMREGIKNMIDRVSGLVVIGETGDGLKLIKMLKMIVPDLSGKLINEFPSAIISICAGLYVRITDSRLSGCGSQQHTG